MANCNLCGWLYFLNVTVWGMLIKRMEYVNLGMGAAVLEKFKENKKKCRYSK